MFLFRSKKAKHGKLRERLSEYLDGRLSPEEAREMEGHLEACPSCRQELASLKAALSLLRQLPQVPVPRSFVLRAEDVQPRPAPSPLFIPLRLAAAATALLLAVVVAGDLVLPQGAPPPAPVPAPAVATETPAKAAPRAVGEVRPFSAGDAAQTQETKPPEATATPAPSLQQQGVRELPWRWLELGLFALLFILVILIVRIRKGSGTAAWGRKEERRR